MASKARKYEAKSKQLIHGVQVRQLKWIPDERRKLMEMLRCHGPMFEKFGQVYITTCYPGLAEPASEKEYEEDCNHCRKGCPMDGRAS